MSEAAGWAPLGTTPEDIGPKAAWSPGNLPLIDNIVVAHCCRPFTGSRRVLVAMPGRRTGRAARMGTARSSAGPGCARDVRSLCAFRRILDLLRPGRLAAAARSGRCGGVRWMSGESVFIRPNLIIEGLVDQFYAWTYLIPPATAAMSLANRQLPILESFVAQPQIHVDAVANRRMRGGLFVGYESGRASEIDALRKRIARQNRELLELAEAVSAADQLLRDQASGFDLTPLYEHLRAALGGFVELVYDREHRANLRFVEPALYLSRYHREARQSVELLLDTGAERPFIFSTPRLPHEGHLQLPLPFRHPGIDTLSSMRTSPRSVDSLRDVLEIEDDAVASRLRSYLTAQPLLRHDTHAASGGRIRYFGHACLLIQSPTVNIIVDPFISGNTNAADDRLTYADLPDHIDFCLITHGHPDHTVLETLLQLRARIDLVVVPRGGGGGLQDPSLKLMLQSLGFPVREVDDFEMLSIADCRIVATPFFGEHCDLDIRGKTTYWISISGKRIFVGADSSGVEPELYANIAATIGGTDIAFLGMECDGAPLTWQYGFLFTQPVSLADKRHPQTVWL